MRCELELSAATKFSMRSGSRSCEVIKYKKGKKFSTLIFIHRFSHGKMCKEFIFHLSWSSLNSKEVSGFPATRMCVCGFLGNLQLHQLWQQQHIFLSFSLFVLNIHYRRRRCLNYQKMRGNTHTVIGGGSELMIWKFWDEFKDF